MRGTRRAAPGRDLKFVSINDEHVIVKHDGGMKNGKPTSDRNAIIHLLRKRVNVDGRDFPVYLLAEVPEQLHPKDPLDLDLLRDRAGNWALPYDEWLEERAKRAKVRADRNAHIQEITGASSAREVIRGFAGLVRSGALPAGASRLADEVDDDAPQSRGSPRARPQPPSGGKGLVNSARDAEEEAKRKLDEEASKKKAEDNKALDQAAAARDAARAKGGA